LPKYQTDCCKFNLERSTDPKRTLPFKLFIPNNALNLKLKIKMHYPYENIFTYAQPAPVTYTVDNKNITLPGENTKAVTVII
jgi:hypothetical protein